MASQSGSGFKQSEQHQGLVAAYARGIVRWRWLVALASLLLVLVAASGSRYLGFSTDYRAFFGETNPQLQAFEELQNVYSRDDTLLFVMQPAEGEVFTAEMLSSVRDLTEAAWQIPYATRVDSITNFQHSYALGEDDLIVEDLYGEDAETTAENLARVRAAALTEPLLVNRIISPDARTTAVAVTLSLPNVDPNEGPEATAKAREIRAAYQDLHPNVHVAITGSVPLNSAFNEASMNDLMSLVPLMYGILLLVMALLLRSTTATFATLLIVGFSALFAMGSAGWLGIKLTPPSASAPTIILTLAIADSIHILISYFAALRQGADKRSAIVESIVVNWQPVLLTSVTTIIGFVSLNFSDSPPFHDLGNITAIGVGAAWLFSITFLPAAMAILPMKNRIGTNGKTPFAERLGAFVLARPRPLLYSMSTLVVVLLVLIPTIELNDQFVEYFDKSLEFRQDTDFAADNLAGIYQTQWSLPAGESGGIQDPAYLKKVEHFVTWLESKPEVIHVNTVNDIFKRLNKNMHADQKEWYRLPEERNLAAQYLLLYEMNLPYGQDLNNQINVDKSSTRVIATVENMSTEELRALDREAGIWLRENLNNGQIIDASGPFVMFAYISSRNIQSMLIGTFFAFVLVSFCLGISLKSLRLGLISLVPNLVPVGMAFGVWAILVGQVGMASSIITATSLGIIVDATVHFLSKYKRARTQHGANAEDGIRYAFSTVGTALWVTSLILVAGFGTLAFSSFLINAHMGMLTAIALTMAILTDFLLLPPLLLAIDGRRTKDTKLSASAPQPAE